MGFLLNESCTEADGDDVESVRVWCRSIGTEFLRLNPLTRTAVPIDATDNRLLVQLLCDTEVFLHSARLQIRQFAAQLLRL